MEIEVFQCTVHHYARRGMFRHVRRACDEAIARNGPEPIFNFWKGASLAAEGDSSEAIFLFEQLVGGKMSYSAWAGLLYLYTRSSSPNEDKIEECKAHLVVDLEDTASDALHPCAAFQLFVASDTRGAKTSIKALKKLGHTGAGPLRGWWELLAGSPKPDFLEEVSSTGGHGPRGRSLESMLVEATYFAMRAAYKEAVELYNQVIVHYPGYVPALLEKAQAFVLMGDWSQAIEAAQRVLDADPGSSQALQIQACHALAVDSDPRRAEDLVREMHNSVRSLEPKNAKLLRSLARPVSRLASRRKEVLAATLEMAEDAVAVDQSDAHSHVELGRQRALAGDYTKAAKCFAQASRLDEGLEDAIHGTLACQLAEGNIEDAEQQIDFLLQIQAEADRAPEVSFMAADLASRKREGPQTIIAHLDRAAEAHIARARRIPYGEDLFSVADPEFAMGIARLYVAQVSLDPSDTGDAGAALIAKAADFLRWLARLAPGLIPCQLLLGRCLYAAGERDEGLRLINQCTALDATDPEIHIALAQIYVAQGSTSLAQASLEQALAHDFAVRELPLYALIKAEALEEQGNLSEAAQVLDAAMQCPGVRHIATAAQLARHRYADVPTRVRVSIFITLARVQGKLGRSFEASKVMNDALNEFKGTAEEVRVTIANCEVSLGRGDIEAALETLGKVPETDPYFVKAKTTSAEIHLRHRGDRKQYMKVYADLMRAVKTVPTYTLAAEAFMRISEPQKAIRAYELALKLSPNDSELASKIGGVLITMHDYRAAIEYYESAVAASPTKLVLRRDLAQLRLRLREYQAAQRVLIDALKAAKQGNMDSDVLNAVHEVSMLVLLSEVTGGLGKAQAVGDLLAKALEKQMELLSRVRQEKPELADKQRRRAARLAIRLAAYRASQGAASAGDAIAGYEEAQRLSGAADGGISAGMGSKGADGGGSGGGGGGGGSSSSGAIERGDEPGSALELYTEATLSLARLHLSRGALDLCQEQCLQLLRVDPSSEEGTMLLADVMFQRTEHTTATYHFEQLLERRPAHFGALARLFVLLRRSGRLVSAAPRLLAQAEHSSARAGADPGFHYCRGLYLAGKAEPVMALREFNRARSDPEWCERAIIQMIDIFLCPDDQDLWEEADEGTKDRGERIASAERLLAEYPDKGSIRHQWLAGQVLLATRDRRNYDVASDRFTEMIKADRDSIPGLLGLAMVNQLQKQQAKAKNFLKRLAKLPFDPKWANELEKAHLILSEIYCDAGKLDQALAAIKTALTFNASSSKAWEYRGRIEEKDAAYADAAESYEKAWALRAERSTVVGFKLAFNFLKAKRWVEAIDVCHKVLKIDPEYPKIHKEVLERARANIRA